MPQIQLRYQYPPARREILPHGKTLPHGQKLVYKGRSKQLLGSHFNPMRLSNPPRSHPSLPKILQLLPLPPKTNIQLAEGRLLMKTLIGTCPVTKQKVFLSICITTIQHVRYHFVMREDCKQLFHWIEDYWSWETTGTLYFSPKEAQTMFRSYLQHHGIHSWKQEGF